jgi:hypothetical protein
MKISVSRLKCFVNSPERYRLQYILNIVPAQESYALIRGSTFHTIMNHKNRRSSAEHIAAVLKGTVPDFDGRTLKDHSLDSTSAFNSGVIMAEVVTAYENCLASEVDFDFEIEGSPHRIHGRIDAIFEDDEGLWVGEYKTASIKQNYKKKEREWEHDYQADFEILGARSLGFDVRGVKVQYVVDSNPPRTWEPMPVYRDNAKLARTQLYTHQICDTIEMFTNTYGGQDPWIHLNNWPCDGGEWCEYRSICQRCENQLDLSIIGPSWKRRDPSPFEVLDSK